MKSNSKKTIRVSIIIIVIAVIIMIIAIILANVNKKEEVLIDNAQIIKDNYTNLSDRGNENTKIRKELTDKLATYTDEKYAEEHNDYLDILNRYNDSIKKIDEIIADTHEKCNEEYDDTSINIICLSYDKLYEEVINLYVTNLTNYNNKITDYNKTSTTQFEQFEMLHQEYIDFDEDGQYRGKSTEVEENKQ